VSLPTVSCIVPVYNGERYLAQALDSIFTQHHQALDVIVVDDGSTDGTAGVATSYGSRVRYIDQQNAGPAAARNRGLEAATGDFVAFLDADDLWSPDKLAVQLGRFAERPDLGYCVAHVQNFWEPELQHEAEAYQDQARAQPMAGYVTGTLMAPRSVFQTVGSFDASLGHGDAADWFLRADAQGAAKELLPDVLLFRRLHPANRSRNFAEDSRGEFLRLLKARLDRRRHQAGGDPPSQNPR
jgi:glycosyltransferase involved in cell wall biosynthesis